MDFDDRELRSVELNREEFAKLTAYIKKRFGQNIPPEKKSMLEGRLSKVLQVLNINDIDDYLDYLFADKTGKAEAALINAVSTNHTFFMREKDHFRYYAEKVLPYFAQNITDYDLRTWCAACSSGEESCTLAMLLREYFAHQDSRWNTQLLATDISPQILAKARRGIYSQQSLAELPPTWRDKYFQPVDEENYKVAPAIMKMIIYRQFNLINEKFPFRQKFHTIFCRNVLIYFDAPTRDKLIRRFHQWLEPNGYLFIGHSEFIDRSQGLFNYVRPAVYRKGSP